ncbi:acyltransferase [Bacillus sp. ISL-7]|uniref:acyltransferase family protein n=1 Tax=Bacillus sp. ISL-7 TaxID=2819136 RepID=UPI001BECEBF4|nr:acyltransferase [Bacillus sp. ISL-7]MBT2738390.1 acyltransferase [Bacillus sp. ISL-7]
MVQKRDINLDILRFIGTLLVILAHVGPPTLVQNIRTFDVIMLIVVSGMSIHKSRYSNNFLSYIYNRFKKLILPLYLILTVIFLINYFTYKVLGISSSGINTKKIIESYLLLDGIGYVWIARVFLIISIGTPLIPKLIKNKSFNLFIGELGLYYIAFLSMCWLNGILESRFIEYFIIQTFPYFIVAMIGYRLYINKSEVVKFFSLSLILLVVTTLFYFLCGKSLLPDDYKYPPQLLYLSYGLSVTFGIYLIINKIRLLKDILNNKLIVFVSINSYYIYLFHILAIFIYNGVRKFIIIDLTIEYLVKYIFVTSISLFLAFIRGKIINNYIKN